MNKLQTNLNKPSYSIPQVARIIGVSPYRVRIMVKLKQLPALLAGKQEIILKEDLEHYLEKRNTSTKLQYQH